MPAAPAAPVLNATYNTTASNVTIAWTAVSGATGYDYQVGTGAVTSTTGTSVSPDRAGRRQHRLQAARHQQRRPERLRGLDDRLHGPRRRAGRTRGPGAQRDLQHHDQQRHDRVDRCERRHQLRLPGRQRRRHQHHRHLGVPDRAGRRQHRLQAPRHQQRRPERLRGLDVVYTVPVVMPAAPAAPVLNSTYNTTTGNVTIAWTA